MKHLLTCLFVFCVVGLAAARAQKPTVAVLQFMGPTLSLDDTSAFTERLRSELERTGHFRVVRNFTGAQMRQFRLVLRSGYEADKLLAASGRALGVENVVAGNVREAPELSGHIVSLHRVNVETQRVSFAADTCNCPEADIADRTVPELMSRLDSARRSGIHPLAAEEPVPWGVLIPLEYAAALGVEVAGIAGLSQCVVPSDDPDHEEWFSMRGEATIILLAIPLVMSGAVCTLGYRPDERGSYLVTLVGALVGFGASALVAAGTKEPAALIGVVLLPPAAAVMGYNLSRQPRNPEPPPTALIYQEEGRVSLGVPQLQYRMHPVDHTVTRNVELVRVRF